MFRLSRELDMFTWMILPVFDDQAVSFVSYKSNEMVTVLSDTGIYIPTLVVVDSVINVDADGNGSVALGIIKIRDT